MFKKQILDEIEIKERKNKINSYEEKNEISSWDKNIEEKDEKMNENLDFEVLDEFIDFRDSRIGGPSSAQPIILYWSETMDLALAKEIRICFFDFNLISQNLTGNYFIYLSINLFVHLFYL